MKRYMPLAICLACGGDAKPSQAALGLLECVDLPRRDCSDPLPPSDEHGARWPTYTEATRQLTDCSTRERECLQRRFGTCSDGKTFTDWSGGFVGEGFYFGGETLVGVWRWSDVSFCEDGTSCPGFGLGDTTCVEVSVHEVGCDCL
jgi:hypothetical protein